MKQEPRKTSIFSSRNKKAAGSRLDIPPLLLKKIFDLMVKSRVLEERLIKIYRLGEAYFWIGGPGEEGFGVPLGLLVHKGQGHDFDWLHLHYRATPTLIAMGMPIIDSVRLTMNRRTDHCTGGRNFSNHYCFPEWNVAPVSSPIEVQYSIAIGTAWAQRRTQSKGITIITGGDAGTAEGDFASSLIWASRKGCELPMLITVQNNGWGISTSYESQHSEKFIAERGKAFGIRTAVINGNDPIESYISLKKEIEYVRRHRKPVLVETMVSRLYGHSSASGANRVEGETDCVAEFQRRLLQMDVLSESEVRETWQRYENEAIEAMKQVQMEAPPESETIWDFIYSHGENADWRKF